jgi:hypothetical protein
MEFVQEVAANSKIIAPLVQQVIEANKSPTSVQKPVDARDPAPTDKLDMERAAILRRVANFKANQQRFHREREDYFAETMAKARANQWPPQTPTSDRNRRQTKTPAGTADRGKHVDEERRTVLRPVVLQRPCLWIEAKGAKPRKVIL